MMRKSIWRSAPLLALFVAALLFIAPLSFTHGDTSSAVAYLKGRAQTAWTVMALIVADESVDPSFLKTTTSANAIGYTVPILAIAAAGEDPRAYPDENLVTGLLGHFDGTQIGDASLLNDDMWGILALTASGEEVSGAAIAQAKNFLLLNQNTDGGWSWGVGQDSGPDMTATAVMALLAAGVPTDDAAIVDAKGYLRGAQNNDGGFGWATGKPTDASNTAWVLSMIHALKESPSDWEAINGNPKTALEALQSENGYFPNTAGAEETAFTPTETSYAVIALLERWYPVATVTPSSALNPFVTYRIEGKSEHVCSGEVATPNPLELIKDVASTCGFTFDIQEFSFGPFLKSVNDDVPEGFAGWLYRVNTVSPSVGAADFVLEEGDDVLWYYAEFEDPIVRAALSRDEIRSGESVVVTVEALAEEGWQALPDATVFAGANTFTTDSDGQATLSLANGAYRVFADKDGHVRSEKELLIVGDTIENSVSLSADLGGSSGDGSGGGSEDGDGDGDNIISFVLDTSNLDFGVIEKGESYQQFVTLENDGETGIHVESVVSGAELFVRNIKLDGGPWSLFETDIASGVAREVTVGLSVPSTFNGSGVQDGNLTFWAVQN